MISLGSRHAVGHRRICHGFNEHEDIGGRAAADGTHHVHEAFRNDFCFSQSGEKTEKLRGLFFRDLFSRSNAGDSCTDHGRGVWHAPDGFHRAAELFLKPLMGLARSNGYHQGIRLDNFPDFMDDFRVELGLHRQNKNIGEGSDLRVV